MMLQAQLAAMATDKINKERSDSFWQDLNSLIEGQISKGLYRAQMTSDAFPVGIIDELRAAGYEAHLEALENVRSPGDSALIISWEHLSQPKENGNGEISQGEEVASQSADQPTD